MATRFRPRPGPRGDAIPGNIIQATSTGPNRLIQQGAHPVTRAQDILDLLGSGTVTTRSPSPRNSPPKDLSDVAGQVFELLDSTPHHIDFLAGQSGLTPMELSDILLQLELEGCAFQLPGARFFRDDRPSPQPART